MTRTKRFGQALEAAINETGVSQKELAAALDVSQPIVSDLKRGVREPTLRQVELIEQRLGYVKGALLIAAGYVAAVLTVEDAIAVDTELAPDFKTALIVTYRGLVKQSRDQARRLRGQ